MKKHLVILTIFFTVISCARIEKISKTDFEGLLDKTPLQWSLSECNRLINLYTFSNYDNFGNESIGFKIVSTGIKISAVYLNKISLAAISRKEAILQRLTDKDFRLLLKDNLEEYTTYTLDENNRIVKNPLMHKDSSNGISFNLYFKNLTEPYRAIELENGYSYFFLENPEGRFGRVVSITGTYADYNIVINDFLRVTVTFSEYDDDGKKLYDDTEKIDSLALIFNALEDKPIKLIWNLNSRIVKQK